MSKHDVIQELKSAHSLEQFIDRSRNCFRGYEALVVSCGPSAKYLPEVIEGTDFERCIIVGIKQALGRLGELVDIHLFNSFNVHKYEYPSGMTPLIVYGEAEGISKRCGSRGPVFAERDVRFLVLGRRDSGFIDSLAYSGAFSANELEKTAPWRPWGPGIMHELAVPLLVHMGVSRITTIGWDLFNSPEAYQHFYDVTSGEGAEGAPRHLQVWSVGPFVRVLRKLVRRVPRMRFFGEAVVNWFRHHAGQTYNLTVPMPGEAALIRDGMADLEEYLENRGIELCVWTEVNGSLQRYDCSAGS